MKKVLLLLISLLLSKEIAIALCFPTNSTSSMVETFFDALLESIEVMVVNFVSAVIQFIRRIVPYLCVGLFSIGLVLWLSGFEKYTGRRLVISAILLSVFLEVMPSLLGL